MLGDDVLREERAPALMLNGSTWPVPPSGMPRYNEMRGSRVDSRGYQPRHRGSGKNGSGACSQEQDAAREPYGRLREPPDSDPEWRSDPPAMSIFLPPGIGRADREEDGPIMNAPPIKRAV